ncbi:MAG: DUF1887 family CARF protein [Candidatus Marinimicrobia bacterium]|nr:DUF1887 family CARF protein [Candidatus Neomarinimicrobiota bacterium]
MDSVTSKTISKGGSQIILVGGQPIPLLLGFLEFQPESVQLLFTKQSRGQAAQLKDIFAEHGATITDHPIPHNRVQRIKAVIDEIIVDAKGPITINLTGGTKLMSIAAYDAAKTKSIASFYVDGRSDSVYNLSTDELHPLSAEISIEDCFRTQGQVPQEGVNVRELPDTTWDLLDDIGKLYFDWGVNKLRNKLMKTYSKGLQVGSSLDLGQQRFRWDSGGISLKLKTRDYYWKDPLAAKMLFEGRYLEYLVAKRFSDVLGEEFEIQVGFKAGFTDPSIASEEKNEIDVLVKRGRQLFFVECKTGSVKKQHIDKLAVIRRRYGGEFAQSILVHSDKNLPSELREQCEDNSIIRVPFSVQNRQIDDQNIKMAGNNLKSIKQYEF